MIDIEENSKHTIYAKYNPIENIYLIFYINIKTDQENKLF